jgi:DNA helicase II / ATP-dependent DNA helicase PcrA
VSASRTAPAPPQASSAQASERDEGAHPRPAGEQSAAGFLDRADARDVLAWMRLLVDPSDASAVVRALARPPIELRQTDLARVIQLARRRKLDLVLGLAAAIETPQVPPEARERIERFLALHRSAAAELDTLAPREFLPRLIDRLNGRGVVEPTEPDAQSLASDEQPDDAPDEQAVALDADADRLHTTLALLREEVLASVGRIGGRLSELRLDTELDISHGVVRYLELLKLSALLQRPAGQLVEEALADVNARLLTATTSLQREIFQTSTLDETLRNARGETAGGCDDRALAQAVAPREEHSLAPFLPRKGVGLALSASDIQTYRSCPLRYKYARVLRIPTEQTLHQRFGIVVHQVLERFHSEGASSLEQMLGLLDASWIRAGFDDGEHENELRQKAVSALTRYHQRLAEHDTQPVWFERQFSFRLGPHHLRGRVDRVDRIAPADERGPGRHDGHPGADGPDAAGAFDYELIDYKTGRPRSAAELEDDIQLSLYALAAREDWKLRSSRQAYYYVLDDVKVPVPRSERDADTVKDVVLDVGEGIMAQEFAPTPSRAVCSVCDYRIVCPAAEQAAERER